LGIEPSPETRLAFHQLSALSSEELAFQGTGVPSKHSPLPVPLTRLIGRENELDAIQEKVISHRLVTLTGFGGVGKTRLALTTAHSLQDFFQAGVAWIDLAPLSDPAQLVQMVVSSLSIPVQSEHDLNDLLINYIGSKQMLLVLDNCEHVLSAAVKLLSLLLTGCPRLHVLTTSRVSLNLVGEVVYTVLPLPVPGLPTTQTEASLRALQSNESIQLFLERAAAVQPDLVFNHQNRSAVVQICRQLDGIPLAIELAAARLRLLTPQQIADRLSDVLRLLARSGPTGLRRHQTLRATLDWSHDLLSPAEKIFLQRLAIFSGSFTLEAAEAVCSDDELKTDSVMGLVAALIDHSLLSVEITASEARYRLHEVTRQYALEKLVDAGEVELMRARHLDYYCKLAEQAEPFLRRSEQLVWLHRLDQETDNLRAALRWATHQKRIEEVQMALRLAGALWLYWYIRCRWDEGLRWSEAVLQASQPLPITDALRVKVLNAVASFSLYMGELEPATQHARACLSASERAGDLEGMILSLRQLGLISMRKVGLGTPDQYLQAGLDKARQIEDSWLVSLLLGDLGLLARIQENWQLSREFYQQQLEFSRASGDRYLRCFALILLADIALHLDDPTQAGEYIRLGLELAREMGNMRAQAACLSNDALLAFQAGQYDRTGQLLREVLNINWEIRDRENTIETLWKIAKLLTEQDQAEKAARLLAAGLAMCSNLKFDIQYFKEIDLELLRKRLRAALGETAFISAWTAGELLDLEQAVELAGVET
jgi:predicted ATPase